MDFLNTLNVEDNSNDFDYKKYVVNKDEINNYIKDYHNGKIKKGYGVDIHWIDRYFVAKENEFYAVVGKKGDGKTTIQQFWFLAWSIANGLHWVVCFKENMDWSVKVNLMSTLLGVNEKIIARENPELHKKASDWVDEHFTFLAIDSMKEGVQVCEAMIKKGVKIHALVLDPANSFDTGFSSNGNDFSDGKTAGKEILKHTIKFCSVHLSQHPTMSGQRKEGDVTSNEAEGGWYFNKASFTYNINRTRGTSENRMQIENVRNKLTGGGETHPDNPLIVHWSPTTISVECGNDRIDDIVGYLRRKFNPLNEVFTEELKKEPNQLPKPSLNEAFGEDIPF